MSVSLQGTDTPFWYAMDQWLTDIITVPTHTRGDVALYGPAQAYSTREKAIHIVLCPSKVTQVSSLVPLTLRGNPSTT